MKRILTMMLVVLLALVMVACDSTPNNTNNAAMNETNQTSNETNEQANETSNDETDAEDEDSAENETTEEESTEEESTEETESEEESSQPDYEFLPINIAELSDDNRPVVTITFENDQKIVLKMVPEVAPNTVNSFLTSINDGFYDGLVFHRIIKDFMIQGGDPDGTGMGGPGFTINDEFYVIDELTVSYLSHAKGIISMAKTQAPNSAGSQFFITHADSTFLDGNYAAFGFVVEGMDVVDTFANVETGANDKPVEDVKMKSVTVDLNGYELIAPVRNIIE